MQPLKGIHCLMKANHGLYIPPFSQTHIRNTLMINNQQNEESLVENFRQGDHDAFRVIFIQFYASLCYFADSLIGENEKVEDIVSEAFKSLWAQCHQFESLNKIRSFLYEATAENCVKYLEALPVLDQEKSELLNKLKNGKEEYVMIEVIRTEIFRLFREEIETLSPKEKAIYKLLYIEGMTTEQIAEKLNLPLDKVKEICGRQFKK